jgi:hypothetical protein
MLRLEENLRTDDELRDNIEKKLARAKANLHKLEYRDGFGYISPPTKIQGEIEVASNELREFRRANCEKRDDPHYQWAVTRGWQKINKLFDQQLELMAYW